MGATYYQRKDRGRRGRKSWVVVVRWQGARELKIVHTEQDAKALVQMIHKQELAGINVLETIRQARVRAAGTPVPDSVPFPALREALATWIERQERTGEIRVSTGMAYRSRLATWVYPHPLPDGRHLGDLAVNQVTREHLGAVIRRVREAGRSLAIVEGIRNPLRGYYADAIETKALPGPNPASDLRTSSVSTRSARPGNTPRPTSPKRKRPSSWPRPEPCSRGGTPSSSRACWAACAGASLPRSA